MNQNPREKLHHSLKRGLVLLIGAGISSSWPSSLPMGREITQAVVGLLIAHAHFFVESSNDNLVYGFLEKVKSIPMELMWESLIRTIGDGVLHALSVMQTSSFNINHTAIAFACQQWNIPIVFTLNFDTLLEQAISNKSRLLAVVLSTNSDFGQQSFPLEQTNTITRQPIIAHLHGSIEGGYPYKEIGSTITSIGAGLSPTKRSFLSKAIQHWDILCAGYSDQDADVFPNVCRTQNNVFWYTHSGAVTSRIREGMKPLGDRFILLSRNSGEVNFSDILFSISPDLERASRRALPMGHSLERESDRLPSVTVKLHLLKDIVEQHLGSSEQERSYASRLIISTILTELTDWKNALQVIGSFNSSNLWFPKHLVNREMMIRGEIADRIEDPNSATQYFKQAGKMSTTIEDLVIANVMETSSLLGQWKRHPLRLDLLLTWLFQIRNVLHRNIDVAQSICLWELADFCHYFAEVLLIPSSLQIYRLGYIHPNFNLLYRLLDKFFTFITNPLRKSLFVIAAYRYIASARHGIQSVLDRQPAYTALSLLRLAEVLAALGKRSQAEYVLSGLAFRADAFYSWVQSGHGIANALCAQAIVAFYRGEKSQAMTFLTQSENLYTSHQSGIKKVRAFQFRVQEW
jgi:hypothetical protein